METYAISKHFDPYAACHANISIDAYINIMLGTMLHDILGALSTTPSFVAALLADLPETSYREIKVRIQVVDVAVPLVEVPEEEA